MEELNDELNLKGGILNQINNNSIDYKPLTKEMLCEYLSKVKLHIPKVINKNVYVSKITYIQFSILNKKDDISIKISKLIRWYNLYTELLKLSDLKLHHILVKHSNLSIEKYNEHRNLLLTEINNIENKINDLYIKLNDEKNIHL